MAQSLFPLISGAYLAMVINLYDHPSGASQTAWVDATHAPLLVCCEGEYYYRQSDGKRYVKSPENLGHVYAKPAKIFNGVA